MLIYTLMYFSWFNKLNKCLQPYFTLTFASESKCHGSTLVCAVIEHSLIFVMLITVIKCGSENYLLKSIKYTIWYKIMSITSSFAKWK